MRRALPARRGQRDAAGPRRAQQPLLFLILILAIVPSGSAVTGGWANSGAQARDADVAAGLAAFEEGDWQRVIEHMGKVVERRPWDDDAHTLLGFAYRKRGDFAHAQKHYLTAIELNPYHRGALEYLGEAYLEMGRPERAKSMLELLRQACRRIAAEPSRDDGLSRCEEWRDLKAAIDAHLRSPAPLPPVPPLTNGLATD